MRILPVVVILHLIAYVNPNMPAPKRWPDPVLGVLNHVSSVSCGFGQKPIACGLLATSIALPVPLNKKLPPPSVVYCGGSENELFWLCKIEDVMLVYPRFRFLTTVLPDVYDLVLAASKYIINPLVTIGGVFLYIAIIKRNLNSYNEFHCI